MFASWGTRPRGLKASSSIGRAPVSKTGGWGFESLLACQTAAPEAPHSEPPATTQRGKTGSTMSIVERTTEFVQSAWAESRKVTWPTREELQESTIVVIVARSSSWSIIFVVDRCLSSLALGLLSCRREGQ